MKKSPVRRSDRLRASEEGPSDAEAGEEPLFLHPRSSIRSHRDQPLGPSEPQSSPAPQTMKATVKEEPKPSSTQGLRGARRKTPESSSSEDEGSKASAPGDIAVSSSAQVPGPQSRQKEPRESGLARPSPAEARRRTPIETRKVEVPYPYKLWPSGKPDTRHGISAPRMTYGKPGKSSTPRWICFLVLPCLLLLPIAGWYFWDFSCPKSLSGFANPISLSQLWKGQEEVVQCTSDCSFVLVESIPVGLTFDPDLPVHLSIFQSWMDLMAQAHHSVDIAAFYFTLQGADTAVEDPSTEEGEQVLQNLMDLPSRGVKLNIAVNAPQNTDVDTARLAEKGADVKLVNLKSLLGGIVHTKIWVVDKKHIYIGSANMDWRSLTQVKELGVVLYNCSCLAQDLHKIFEMYRYLGDEGASVPSTWPNEFSAASSHSHPQHVLLNGSDARVYISSSPHALCAARRTSDLDAILGTIDDAQEFVYIAVMDFIPQQVFSNPKRFWPVIDDRLRSAACDRGVMVRLLVSCWSHSNRDMFIFLESLSVLSHAPLRCPIEVKLFVVPATEKQKTFPFTRVNHNKYMVTDRIAYIGTSNWSEDYFSNTAGVGVIINQTGSGVAASLTAQGQLKAVFLRDWNSEYTRPLSDGTRCAAKS
ncbi:5'-3' exonuclease PLD3-like isoform X2 [Ambystoma mexicanum]|uniref:5'-3' exonuclease PLD3-like isoform X2 n=1 Tax=Ambystoma mexicanum TaxID=8296 RepID=UPI0037E85BD5